MRILVHLLSLGLIYSAPALASRLTFIDDREFTTAQLESAHAVQVQLDELFGLLPPFSADTSAHQVVFALSGSDLALKIFGKPVTVKHYTLIPEQRPQVLILFWDLIQADEFTVLQTFEPIAAFLYPRLAISRLPTELSNKAFELNGMLIALRSLLRSNQFAQLTREERWETSERIKKLLEGAPDLIVKERKTGVDCAALLMALYN